MITPIEILTPRFRMRELNEGDVTARYLGWLAEPTALRYIESAQKTHQISTLAEFVRQRINRSDVLLLGVFEKTSGLHIGNIKYEPIDSINGYAIMGILIGDPDFRGKGVAAEVVFASAKWLKEHRSIRQILLGVNIENLPAIQAYKKIGFVNVESSFIIKSRPNIMTMGLFL